MGSKPIAEFCGLKPKLYSIKLAEGKYKSFFQNHSFTIQKYAFNKNRHSVGIRKEPKLFSKRRKGVMLCKRCKFFSGSAKQSAKGVTKDARRSMTHELYKRTLLGGEVVRLLNTRIASSNHRLHTIAVNKKSLSGYDDKRFILSDQVSTLPYGHSAIRKDMFFRTIVNEPDWGADDLGENKQESGQQAQESRHHAQDSSQQVKNKNQHKNKRQTQQSANVPQTNSILNTSFSSIPDPGFHQRSYSEDELNQKLVDFDNLSDFSDSGSSADAACDGFILSQAIEDSDSTPQPPITIDEQPSANLPVTIDEQNLQDQPPTKKRRRSRIIESNSEQNWRTKQN